MPQIKTAPSSSTSRRAKVACCFIRVEAYRVGDFCRPDQLHAERVNEIHV